MFTLSPLCLEPSVVAPSVWGIRETETRSPSTSTKVKLIPSTAIDPFGTANLASSLPSFIQIFVSDGIFWTSSITPVPSTWPKTKCPSSLSPTFMDLSMFTASPGVTLPRFVLLIVSATISNSASPFDSLVTVRQAPFMQTLSPFLRPRASLPSFTLRAVSAPLLLLETDLTLPMPSTMPVNISGLRPWRVGEHHVVAGDENARNILFPHQALDGVALALHPGEVTALVGENGAGKSTIVKILTGIYRPSAGRIWLAGRALGARAPHEFAAAGIGRTFQNLQIFFNMTAAENVIAGGWLHQACSFFSALLRTPGRIRAEREARAEAQALLEFVGLARWADAAAEALPYGALKRLEIARALAGRPKLLLLDEPAAGLNPSETREIDELIRCIAERGVSVVLVEHNMKLVMEVSQRVLVLHEGRKLAEGEPHALIAKLQAAKPFPHPPSKKQSARGLRERGLGEDVELADHDPRWGTGLGDDAGLGDGGESLEIRPSRRRL